MQLHIAPDATCRTAYGVPGNQRGCRKVSTPVYLTSARSPRCTNVPAWFCLSPRQRYSFNSLPPLSARTPRQKRVVQFTYSNDGVLSWRGSGIRREQGVNVISDVVKVTNDNHKTRWKMQRGGIAPLSCYHRSCGGRVGRLG